MLSVMQMMYMIVVASNIVLSALFGVICPGRPYGRVMSKVDNGGHLWGGILAENGHPLQSSHKTLSSAETISVEIGYCLQRNMFYMLHSLLFWKQKCANTHCLILALKLYTVSWFSQNLPAVRKRWRCAIAMHTLAKKRWFHLNCVVCLKPMVFGIPNFQLSFMYR